MVITSHLCWKDYHTDITISTISAGVIDIAKIIDKLLYVLRFLQLLEVYYFAHSPFL